MCTVEDELRISVINGAALLDRHHPGWAAKIDIALLDLSMSAYCILGQLYGKYPIGKDELAIKDPVSYGFISKTLQRVIFSTCAPLETELIDIEKENESLRALWIQEIAKKLEKSSPVKTGEM